jgi:bifunctional DNA-binding transcriptional regulator/antitoxin component of YhaV-PrlF toxin-antitoxin module
MPSLATLSRKFQISVPRTVRERQRWKVGQELAFIPERKGVLLMPVPALSELAGIAKGARSLAIRDRKDRF